MVTTQAPVCLMSCVSIGPSLSCRSSSGLFSLPVWFLAHELCKHPRGEDSFFCVQLVLCLLLCSPSPHKPSQLLGKEVEGEAGLVHGCQMKMAQRKSSVQVKWLGLQGACPTAVLCAVPPWGWDVCTHIIVGWQRLTGRMGAGRLMCTESMAMAISYAFCSLDVMAFNRAKMGHLSVCRHINQAVCGRLLLPIT